MHLSQVRMENHMKKRVFIGLLGLALLVLFAIFSAAWWIVAQRGLFINQVILVTVTATAILLMLILAVGLAALVWSLWRAKTIPSMQSMMATATNFLFPLAIRLGKWLGIDEDRIKNSYIQVSNQLVKTRLKAHPTGNKRIMILAPHCLQWVECPHKITIDVNNCKECGRCPISELKDLSRRYQTELQVVTGGTSARKVLLEKRPSAVVAIACERDLTSGIQDVSVLPVLGVINQRPEGPCYNTRVDLRKVEESIRLFRQGGS